MSPSVTACSTHIVTVQHSEELRVCDELDGRRLEEMVDLLVIDRRGGACTQTAGVSLSLFSIQTVN